MRGRLHGNLPGHLQRNQPVHRHLPRRCAHPVRQQPVGLRLLLGNGVPR
jgi:hypothetical protein